MIADALTKWVAEELLPKNLHHQDRRNLESWRGIALVVEAMALRGFNDWQISHHLCYQVGPGGRDEYRWRAWVWQDPVSQFVSEPEREPRLAVFAAARNAVEGKRF